MNQKISFESFLSKLTIKSDIPTDVLESLVFDLFVHIRTNTECGLWVEIDGFGSFHPLWYEIKKHKEDKDKLRITQEIESEHKKRTLSQPKEKEETPKELPKSTIIKEPTVIKNNKVVEKSRVLKIDKKTLLKYLLSGFVILVIIFAFLIVEDDEIQISENNQTLIQETPQQLYNGFTNVEPEKMKTSEKFYKHTVVWGDTLYSLSRALYGDSKYWPLIYVENMKTIKDMDNIHPKDVLKIPRIPQSSTAQKELAEVYIQTYKEYKHLGKDNKAHWLLYWGSQNIDYDLLDIFSEDISSEDRKKVKEYLKRFGEEQ